MDISTETGVCVGCAHLIKERRKASNKYITLKAKYDEIMKVVKRSFHAPRGYSSHALDIYGLHALFITSSCFASIYIESHFA